MKQKKLDKETFNGMFDRGQLYEEEDPSTTSIEELDDDVARERKFKKEVRRMIRFPK